MKLEQADWFVLTAFFTVCAATALWLGPNAALAVYGIHTAMYLVKWVLYRRLDQRVLFMYAHDYTVPLSLLVVETQAWVALFMMAGWYHVAFVAFVYGSLRARDRRIQLKVKREVKKPLVRLIC